MNRTSKLRTGLVAAAKDKVTAMFEGDETYSKLKSETNSKVLRKKLYEHKF